MPTVLQRIRRLAAAGLCVTAAAAAAEPLSDDDPRIEAMESRVIARPDRGDPNPARHALIDRMAHYGLPGMAVAILQDGEVAWVRGYGTREQGKDAPVGPDTVFSVGSISKIANAALILRLVAEGRLDLDADVNRDLTSWRVPDNRHTHKRPVTLRAILSHTAGFNVHGFPDFQPGEDLPTALDTLNGRRPARNSRVRVTFEPGSKMDYSGGGVTVSQVLVEDVTGLSYEEAARRYVFDPLGMDRSTFVNPLSETHGDIAHAHDEDGAPTALPRGYEAMAEWAASGLWTSARDLGRLVAALMGSARGDNDFLAQDLAMDMMTREANSWHGLGPQLNGEGPTRVFHHSGSNDSYRAWMEGHLASGAGIVILTNSVRGAYVRSELRYSAQEAFDWPIDSETGFEYP